MGGGTSDFNERIKEQFAGKLLRAVGPSAIVCAVAVIFSIYPTFYPRRMLIPVLGLAILGVVYFFRRRGRPIAAVNVMVSFLTVIFLIAVFLNGGVRTPAYVGMMLCLVIVAWFWGVRMVLAYLAMVVATGGLALFLGRQGFLPKVELPSPFFYWVIFSIYYTGVAALLILSYGLLCDVLRSLGERENLLSSIYASLNDPLFVLDSNGVVVEMNLRAMELSEALTEEQCGKSVMDLEFDMDGERVGKLSELLKEEAGMVSGIRVKTRCAGKRRWFLLSSAPLSGDGKNDKTVLLMRDITGDVVREYHLEHSRKMEALGRLAGGIAHDFNNMLAAIIGSVEVLRSGDDAGREEMLDIIYKAGRKASHLTGELLVFSRKSPTGKTEMDIHRVVRDIVLILSRTVGKKINIRMELNAADATISGDDALIHSSLINMGINAAHAMPGGGTLTFRTSNVEIAGACDEKYPGFDVSSGGYLLVEVEDTGVGIPEELIDRVFEPFFTTKKTGEGTGLGLYVVYGMASKHSGAIRVRRRDGGGTVFDLLLPLSGKEGEGKSERGEVDETVGSGVLLVVDDEELVRAAQARLLESFGYTVLVASGGMEALDILGKTRVDAVVLDLAMPEMTGEELFDEMLKMEYDTPTIAISGYASEDEVSRMLEKGLVGFLQKPCERKKLAEMVAKCFRRGES